MRDDDTELLDLPLIPRPQRGEVHGGGRALAAVLSDLVEVPQPGVAPEGYHVEVRGGRATVRAADARGFRYARVTLDELARLHDGQVPDIAIDDAPVLARRGIIEGFYGEPWSHAERLAAVAFAGRLKLNSYVYAPKDDPFHRERWREPYPSEDLTRLVDLAEEGAKHGVDVVVALHPAGSMVFADDAEHELLASKARQLLDAGIPDVALLFDDVPPTPVHERDKARFGEDDAALGEAHALTIRRFQDAVGSHLSDGHLLVVPMDYAGTAASEYRTAFAAGLPDSVLVWWTGADIVVGEITRQDIDAAAEVFGDRLLLWDNFPVNDFDRGRAFLGPLLGRTTEVAGSVLHGAWSNPMVEYVPGGFGIASFADWAWNPAGYVAARSAKAALQVVAGPRADALAPLVRTLSSWPPSAPMDQSLADAADRALESASNAAELRMRLEQWRALADVDTSAEPARSLEPWLRAAVDMAAAGLIALDLHEGHAGSTATDTAAALARAEAHKAKVGVDVIPEFVRQVLKRSSV
ncbi:beta-N-acetylglucosaminidase domain-containing protein [Microbacterium murale]|uniref:Hyaluronoglucosaminidase n=1 Tax=Microbacterium murale TaxID=1081040 RepID=A0ABU0P6Z8_9MICO|nr:beta-N-acetylglucosaminidase domain-containing protein [Microbacterium murale]MDQ0643112.1 hyaluronoglucosaminidase [Microbacterium murale]